MNKIKAIRRPKVKPTQNGKFDARFGTFKPTLRSPYMDTANKVEVWLDDMMKVLTAIRAIHPHVTFKEPLDDLDWVILTQKIAIKNKRLREILMPPTLMEEEETGEVTRVTVAHIIQNYVDDRDAEIIITPKGKRRLVAIPTEQQARYTFFGGRFKDKDGNLKPITIVSKLARRVAEDMTAKEIATELRAMVKQRGNTDATYNRYRIALRGAWSYYCKTNKGFPNPAAEVDDVAENPSETINWQDMEVAEILYTMGDWDAKSRAYNEEYPSAPQRFVHSEAYGRLLANTAMRADFLMRLNFNDHVFDLNGSDPTIRMVMKSSTKEAIIPLDKSDVDLLKAQKKLTNAAGFVFPYGEAHPTVFYRTFNKRINRLSKKGVIRKSKKPTHSFRSHAATRLSQMGMTVQDVAVVLDVSVTTALIYIKQDEEGRKGIRATMGEKNSALAEAEAEVKKRRRHLRSVK